MYLKKQLTKTTRLAKAIALASVQFFTVYASAQQIDFNLPGKETQGMEDGFVGWSVGRGMSSEGVFDVPGTGNQISISLVSASVKGSNAVMGNWWKDGVSRYSRLTSDGVFAIYLDAENNYNFSATEPMGLKFTIRGLSAGKHTLQAYHNNTDGLKAPLPTLCIKVNGTVVQSGVQQTIRQEKTSDAGQSYITFEVKEGKDVVVEYISEPKAGETYANTSVVVNALLFDSSDAKHQAVDPVPANLDYHAAADQGTMTVAWTAASGAVRHNVYLGTSAESLQIVAETDQPSCQLSNLSTHNTYYWRVDEVAEDGTVTEGDLWQFRTRRQAFPGAEGYGQYAIGGRGGVVYHVTTLDDNGDNDNPVPGSFRYGIKKVQGPRTIVFDVAGVINLKTRLTCSDRYVTIAGQTAPGNGIMLRTSPFGMQSDGITRFIRMRLGHKRMINGVIPSAESDYGMDAGQLDETRISGLDGMGMAGNDHAIMDHCSISWTIDEAFSSRSAKNMTLQRTLISEALNQAGHPNYGKGTRHGYAATIGGGEMSAGLAVGSYHHNLLAHCEGRNWSLSGGLDGGGSYDGHHDIFNNVVYNWGGRATDGGSHEINFVSNFYKKGPATSQNILMNLQLEGTGKGTQSVYCNGNIRQETSGALTQDAKGTTYKYTRSSSQTVDWEPLATKPFFESLAVVETAQSAYKNTLSDVGCTMPMLDVHDVRMISETLAGTTSTVGSQSRKLGLIDSEEDAGCEGFDGLGIVAEKRPEGWDTDRDGMPDWWEEAMGYNPMSADNNLYNEPNGYTHLEEYLNWAALPHITLQKTEPQTVALQPYFAGYNNNPRFTVVKAEGVNAKVEGMNLVLEAVSSGLATVAIEATDDDGWGTLVRQFNVYVPADASGIVSVSMDDTQASNSSAYTVSGQKVDNLQHGVYIVGGKKVVKR